MRERSVSPQLPVSMIRADPIMPGARRHQRSRNIIRNKELSISSGRLLLPVPSRTILLLQIRIPTTMGTMTTTRSREEWDSLAGSSLCASSSLPVLHLGDSSSFPTTGFFSALLDTLYSEHTTITQHTVRQVGTWFLTEICGGIFPGSSRTSSRVSSRPSRWRIALADDRFR